MKSDAGAGTTVPRVACIANPNARDGKLGKNFDKIEKALEASGLEHDVFMTEGTGHAIEIASGLRESDYDLLWPLAEMALCTSCLLYTSDAADD